MNEIIAGTEEIFFTSCNPLLDVFHTGSIKSNTMRSGQPIMVYGTDEIKCLDLIYSVHPSDDLQEEGEAHECEWSVYTDQIEASQVIDKLNEFDFLKTSLIKHPVLDEWAVTSSNQVFGNIPDGETKTWLYNKAVESIMNGRRHNKQYMIDNGWLR